ncbi:hypothetical protein Tco_1381126, partial [Tanacetum coccineum]
VNEARGAKDTLRIPFWGHPQSPTHLSTLISSQGESFGGADEELSDGGPEHPPSPDYVPGPEHPPSPAEPFDDDDDDDDTDDEDEEPFEDKDDDEEEDEEHLAPADSPAIPIGDLIPLVGDTKAFETDETAPTPVP